MKKITDKLNNHSNRPIKWFSKAVGSEEPTAKTNNKKLKKKVDGVRKKGEGESEWNTENVHRKCSNGKNIGDN